MNDYISVQKNECCSCGNCAAKCPKKCITLKEDERGFSYPEIDFDKCVKCGLCKTVCPMLSANDLMHCSVDDCFSLINKEKSIREKSSSGGAFVALVKAFYQKYSGFVWGVRLDNKLQAVHDYIEKIEDCEKFCKSKYIKSNLFDCYQTIETQLKTEKKVLFSGTPCQTAGLLAFLGQDYENLITVDFVCHGTPSQKMFDKYISSLKGSVSEYSFRYDDGKKNTNSMLCIEGKSIVATPSEDDFLRAFDSNLLQMESCFECPFADKNRVSDITLGDFWGLEKEEPTALPYEGISLVILNTEKGQKLFQKIQNCETKKYNINVAVNGNPHLKEPAKKNMKLYDFANVVNKKNFHKATINILGKPIRPSLKSRIKNGIKKIIIKIGIKI